MGWSIGYDNSWGRDVGYGVPSICDHPDCNKEIDRGLSYVCGSEPYGGEYGCGLFFCEEHLYYRKPHGSDRLVQLCPRCMRYRNPYNGKPDIKEWIEHKLTHESWGTWRKDNKEEVKTMQKCLKTMQKKSKLHISRSKLCTK